MTTEREATIEDLALTEGKAEIVNGEFVLMTPVGGFQGVSIDQSRPPDDLPVWRPGRSGTRGAWVDDAVG